MLLPLLIVVNTDQEPNPQLNLRSLLVPTLLQLLAMPAIYTTAFPAATASVHQPAYSIPAGGVPAQSSEVSAATAQGNQGTAAAAAAPACGPGRDQGIPSVQGPSPGSLCTLPATKPAPQSSCLSRDQDAAGASPPPASSGGAVVAAAFTAYRWAGEPLFW